MRENSNGKKLSVLAGGFFVNRSITWDNSTAKGFPLPVAMAKLLDTCTELVMVVVVHKNVNMRKPPPRSAVSLKSLKLEKAHSTEVAARVDLRKTLVASLAVNGT